MPIKEFIIIVYCLVDELLKNEGGQKSYVNEVFSQGYACGLMQQDNILLRVCHFGMLRR
ncbi:MAG: hypothetical protein V4700_02210 [Pseudomonadota bacterium]